MQYWHYECKGKNGNRAIVVGAITMFVVGICLIILGVM